MKFQGLEYTEDQIPIIDERETPVKEYLEFHPELPYKIAMLEIGDILLPNFPIEIKRITYTCDDLKASFFGEKDRVHEQSFQRFTHYPRNGLILQKECEFDFDEKYTSEKINHLFGTLMVDFDTHLFYTKCVADTIFLVYYILWNKILRGEHKMTCERKEAKPLNLYEMQIYLVSSFYDTGYKTAIDLLVSYHTPSAIFNDICRQEITYTKGGNPRNPVLPDGLKGIGPKFFIKNKPILDIPFDLEKYEKAKEEKKKRNEGSEIN